MHIKAEVRGIANKSFFVSPSLQRPGWNTRLAQTRSLTVVLSKTARLWQQHAEGAPAIAIQFVLPVLADAPATRITHHLRFWACAFTLDFAATSAHFTPTETLFEALSPAFVIVF